MVKIIKMEPVADMDGNLEDIVSYLNQVKNALEDLIDQYDENPELEDKASELTEALDALEDASDIIDEVRFDD